MRLTQSAALAAAALLFVSFGSHAAATKLLRFPDVRHDRIVFSYAGDLWTVGTQGGTAVRLTSNPGLELFGKFSPDGRFIAFTGQYGGDEQVYVIPSDGGAPKQLTFYPAPGPLADRWGYDNQVYGWTPDGTAVLFRSARDGYILTDSKLYTVSMNGGAATALPMPVSGAGHFSPDGKKIVYSPLWRDFRSEKRYQGGWANDLYIFDLSHPALLQVTDDPRTDRDPMWIGDAIYFNSDRTGVFNLFRYDVATGQTRQLTHYLDWDVRWPSADADGQIVYESDGELHVYDTRDDRDRALSIVVPTDATTAQPQTVNAADNIESLALSPGGERLGIAARGDVFSVPVEHGITRNLTRSSSAHDREIAWSSDGKRLAYVSDRSGEDEIYLQTQDGTQPAVQLSSGSTTRYYAPRWSGDDERIAFSDNTGRLHVIEVATRRGVIVARDPAELTQDYRWSPDGQFLSYSLNEPNGFSGVFIWSAADGKSRRITPPSFNAHSPAWAPNGELLYFLSEREYQPLLSTIEFDFATDRQTGIFGVTLRKDVKNPFGIRDDEPGDDKKNADAEADSEKNTGKDRANGKHGGKNGGKNGERIKNPVKIEFEGIEQRVIRVPLEADNLTNLQVGDESLLYQRSGPLYYGREAGIKAGVMAYSIKDREAKPVAEDVVAWSATADGKHVLAQLSSKEIKYFEVGKSEDAKTVSLAGLMTTRIPAAEWREIFAEVWRRYRDYFYVENMHGYDWQELREKYQPLLDYVGSRADLNYVIAEMISELTVQHAYIEGGDLGLPKRPFVALPGARFELDLKSGRYRIAKIFAGQNEEERYRSPLTEVGVDVRVGDYVLAINGRELRAGTDPYELLQAVPNQPVEWRISAGPDGKGARTIRYQPLNSETGLLYLAWVTANRTRVDRMSQGRLGYIHIPDMGEAGIREFIKWWYPQVRKEGLVVDVRDNGGGNISELLIERLGRALHGTSFARNSGMTDTYPRVVQPGPKVALINEDTSSDGDIFSYAFRQWKIGALIGKRTWGGTVGITDHGPLLDGGTVFVPEFGTADENGRWIIEGHGVDPDIVVEQDPVEVLQGHDPQLERGIQELMKRLPATPAGLPQRAAPPVKTGMH
ncbi:MAG: tricorn protease [Gammaproteobacteria bacterium]|nr:tricorn protease [Gammaproteobacteria bacterium]